MVRTITGRIKEYTTEQLDAVIEVLESLDTDEWHYEIKEYGLCDAVSDVDSLQASKS